VGRTVTVTFGKADATPDLHEVGPILARVTKVALEGSPPSERITAAVVAPPALEGLTVALALRYEDEPISDAEAGGAVTVEAFITDAGGRAVAGGIGTLRFAGEPHASPSSA
jgi:hypothetical protein